jgi:hypothetical protein
LYKGGEELFLRKKMIVTSYVVMRISTDTIGEAIETAAKYSGGSNRSFSQPHKVQAPSFF